MIAKRRFQRRLAKKHAAFVWEHVWGNEPNARWVARHWQHLKRCSCVMCGNQRRHFGEVTRQESLAAIREREQRREIEDQCLQ